MRLWIAGQPGASVPPGEIVEQAKGSLAAVESLPVYGGPVACRVRFVFEFPGDGEQPTEEQRAAFNKANLPSLAWYYLALLVGLLYDGPEQVTSVHASKEYGRAAGVEVIA